MNSDWGRPIRCFEVSKAQNYSGNLETPFASSGSFFRIKSSNYHSSTPNFQQTNNESTAWLIIAYLLQKQNNNSMQHITQLSNPSLRLVYKTETEDKNSTLSVVYSKQRESQFKLIY